MEKITLKKISVSFIMLCVFGIHLVFAQEYCIQNSEQISGTQNGYRYELWNQNRQGTACMTVGDGALFSGEWIEVENYLARRGLKYNETQEHQDIGWFYTNFNCNYNPEKGYNGNSYLSVYGWTVDPLIEYYIVEDWRNWIPSKAATAIFKGTFTINGSVYDIYENTRVSQPSIKGTTTFKQYFSIRKNVRNAGTINISDHFYKWEELGMDMGKMYEVSFVVEGYQNSGTFEFTELDITVSDESVGVDEKKNDNFSVARLADGTVLLQFGGEELNSEVVICDALGRIVYSGNASGKEYRIETLSARGPLFCRVKNDVKLLVE